MNVRACVCVRHVCVFCVGMCHSSCFVLYTVHNIDFSYGPLCINKNSCACIQLHKQNRKYSTKHKSVSPGNWKQFVVTCRRRRVANKPRYIIELCRINVCCVQNWTYDAVWAPFMASSSCRLALLNNFSPWCRSPWCRSLLTWLPSTTICGNCIESEPTVLKTSCNLLITGISASIFRSAGGNKYALARSLSQFALLN